MHFGMSAGTHHLVSVVSAEFDIWTVPSGSSVVKALGGDNSAKLSPPT
jgi:hypothetical protein